MNLTSLSYRDYSVRSVLKTPQRADSPAPESRGFFTSIDQLWPGVRLIKYLIHQEIRQPSCCGFEPLATPSKGVKLKINSKEAIMAAHSLVFQSTQFDVVDHSGQPWLRLPQIGAALGYANHYHVQKIYASNADEFTDKMTALVELETNGGKQKVRIFSLRGAHLLGMFARTAIAKEFRKWVLDILEQEPELMQIPQQFITAAQAGELATLIQERFPDGIDRPYAWSRFNKHFRIARYRELPASHFMEACRYIPTMPGKDEIKQLTGQSVKLLPKPDYLLPPDQAKEIMDRLNRLGKMFHPFSDQFLDVLGVIRALHGRNPKLGLEESGYRKVI